MESGDKLKKFIYRYRKNKFKRFLDGLTFAVISIISLIICHIYITDHAASLVKIILFFIIALLSLFLGFAAMFHNSKSKKRQDINGLKINV